MHKMSEAQLEKFWDPYHAEIGRYILGPCESELGTLFGIWEQGDRECLWRCACREDAIHLMEQWTEADSLPLTNKENE